MKPTPYSASSGLRAGPLDPATAEARFARRVASRLSAQSEALPPDLGERLRFARERALERAATPVVAPASILAGSMALAGLGAWIGRVASLLPLLALAAGLVWIQTRHDDEQAQTAADIDAALLSDDLPPTAYSDPGFAEFLKSPGG